MVMLVINPAVSLAIMAVMYVAEQVLDALGIEGWARVAIMTAVVMTAMWYGQTEAAEQYLPKAITNAAVQATASLSNIFVLASGTVLGEANKLFAMETSELAAKHAQEMTKYDLASSEYTDFMEAHAARSDRLQLGVMVANNNDMNPMTNTLVNTFAPPTEFIALATSLPLTGDELYDVTTALDQRVQVRTS